MLCGSYDLIKHLAIKHPQHVHAMCGQYRFPLFAALYEGYVEVAELLLELGTNIDIRDTTGETLLLKALSWPQKNIVDIVKFLLGHGTDVNSRNKASRSSLHLAEYGGRLEVAQMLVEHKADVNSLDDEGKAPLHILLEYWSHDEGDVLNHTELLLEHGAEVDR